MTSSIPPYPYFNGISYNSAFFTSIDSGLTIAQANSKYLQKTIPDTATAIETFSGGINTALINSTSSTTNMTIASNLAPTSTLTLGSTGTYTVNNGTLQTQSLASVNTGSIMNIGANHGSVISIGQAGVSTTNLYGTTQASAINAFSVSSAMTIGSNLTGGSVTIGGTGTVTLSKPMMSNPITPSYNPSTITTGQIGFSITPTYNTPYNLSGQVVRNIATYSLPIGVYYIQANILTPTAVTFQGLGISLTSGTIEYECWSNILTDGYVWFALNVSRMVVITTASTPYYVIAQAGDTRTLLNVKTQCFRIA